MPDRLAELDPNGWLLMLNLLLDTPFKQDFQRRLRGELLENILPFWGEKMPDPIHGGFYGAMTNDLRPLNDTLRSAVLCSRILWSFSAAYHQFPRPELLETARRAFDALTRVFWDPQFGGLYWSVDRFGQPVESRKQVYAQAFGIYALSEYSQACGQPESLAWARRLFALLEASPHDRQYSGYVEGCDRHWQVLADSRLSEKEPYCRKSMNTLLHVMEAYTNLLRTWRDPQLEACLRELLEIFLHQVIDPVDAHLRLFFDDDWTVFPGPLSYGHEIEASWLLVEAAETLGDPALQASARQSALALAERVYEQGRDQDGSIFYEGSPDGIENDEKHWWVQAEGVVGFYNAFQLSGQAHYAEAAWQCWMFIENYLVDRVHGEWFKVTDRLGRPELDRVKAGPWECPYHHSRTALEMIRRLGE